MRTTAFSARSVSFANIVVRGVCIALALSACVAPLRPTLTGVQDPTLLAGLHGTLLYYQDDVLRLVPLDGSKPCTLALDEEPSLIGGIDRAGRVVYSRDRISSPWWSFITRESHFVYDVRVRIPEHGEDELRHGEGFVDGIALTDDGRVAMTILDVSDPTPGHGKYSIVIRDLNTRVEREFPLPSDGHPRGAQWSSDGRVVRYWIDVPSDADVQQIARASPSQKQFTPVLCELDPATGETRRLFPASIALPVGDTDALAVVEQGSETFSVIVPSTMEQLRTARSVPDTTRFSYMNRLRLIAAPTLDVVVFEGNPPPGTKQEIYHVDDLDYIRMWSVDLANLTNGHVATVVKQYHAREVVFSRADLSASVRAEPVR